MTKFFIANANITSQPERMAGVSSGTEEFARDRLRRPGVTVTPRRLWPTGMAALGLDATGRIPAEVAAEPGRCVGRLTDIGWGSTLRKVLADDHSLVRRGFRRMLEDDDGIEVVGEAGDGDEAIALTERLKPAVVVMDCAMPGTSGLVATRTILGRNPKVAASPPSLSGRS